MPVFIALTRFVKLNHSPIPLAARLQLPTHIALLLCKLTRHFTKEVSLLHEKFILTDGVDHLFINSSLSLFFKKISSSEQFSETSTNEILNDSILNETQKGTVKAEASSSSSDDATPKPTSTPDIVDTTIMRPTKVKDFTVLANLVQLVEHSMPNCDPKW